MVKEITTHIKNQLGTSWVIGVNIFAGYVPSSITADCLIIIDSGGVPEFDLSDYIEKRVQIISRAKDYHTAMANAMSAFDVLHGKAGITLPVIEVGAEYYVNTITSISAPQSLGQDERGLFNISANYLLKMQDK